MSFQASQERDKPVETMEAAISLQGDTPAADLCSKWAGLQKGWIHRDSCTLTDIDVLFVSCSWKFDTLPQHTIESWKKGGADLWYQPQHAVSPML